MTTYGSSTVSRVLAIPELLFMIFQFLDDASNASNVRVSKRWSEIALDVLWKEVLNLHHLFSLLAPLEQSGSTYKFIRLLESSDWLRFERYRRRVRRLIHSSSQTKQILHHSVFDDVARSRTSLDILPNMHTFHWDDSLAHSVIFMHKNVKSFALSLPKDNSIRSSIFTRFFEDIVTRMPKISSIDLRFEFPVKLIEGDVIRLLSNLPNLDRITLPRFCLTTKIAETASRLGKLQTLEYQYHRYQGRGDPADIVDFRPKLTEVSFPSLFDFSTTIAFEDAIKFLTIPFSPSNLTIIYLDSPTTETPTTLSALLNAIPEACPLLKSLTLTSALFNDMELTSAPEKEDCVNIDTLRPLLKCPKLTSFEIEHHYPLHLELSDIEEIATSWPGVETLVLNPQPTYLEDSNLTLRALLPFARHCSKLQRLGLFMDATTIDFPAAESTSVYQLPTFRSLHCLTVGVSLIQEDGAVALFLSQICPLHCEIEKGVTWENPVSQELADKLELRLKKWEKVEELLPLLTKLRIEERERAHLLKQEVQDLRIRTEVLMDKFALAGTPVNLDGCITL
ncbi:hypothetical protein J132_00962 [Termitomyces sp. J132]|nr:hypothetical protein J132_00962 [Termitomyces sp. J132]